MGSVFFTKKSQIWLSELVRPNEFYQSNLRFLVKNTLLNNRHLQRFNTVCTPFPMERHKCDVPCNEAFLTPCSMGFQLQMKIWTFYYFQNSIKSNLRFLVKNTLLNNSHLKRFVRTHEFNQSNLRFLVKNTLLNNSHLERFNFFEACINLKKIFCHFFPMERHYWKLTWRNWVLILL